MRPELRKVLFLTAGGKAPAILANRLLRDFPDMVIAIEPGEPRSAFLKRRARKIGWLATLHQFPMMVVSKAAKPFVENRYREIETQFQVSMTMPESADIRHIESANAPDFLALVAEYQPDLVFIAGARMLKPATLQSIACPVLNFHAGITPQYRGLNGGYWALHDGRPELFGGTLHLVDKGVDTGAVIAQETCVPARQDNFLTYQHLITAACADMCAKGVAGVLDGTVDPVSPEGESRQHFHPALLAYLWSGLTRRIW